MYKISVVWIAILLSCVTQVCAQEVRVSGECVGVKVYTDGLLITDTVTLTETSGRKVDIASGYGIKKGDIIKKVNGQDAVGAKTVSDALTSGDVSLTLLRNGKEFDVTEETIRRDLDLPKDCPVIPFSAEKGTGRDDLVRIILDAVNA